MGRNAAERAKKFGHSFFSLDILKQVAHRDTQPSGQHVDDSQAGLFLGILQVRQVSGLDSRFFR